MQTAPLPDLSALPRAASDRVLDRLPDAAVPRLLRQQALDAVRRHPTLLDTDAAGALVVRSEVVAIDPSPESLDRARAAGFDIATERRLDELGLRLVVLRARGDIGTRTALRRLRRADPDGEYDYNHLYRGSGTVAAGAAAPAAAAAESDTTGRPLRIGLIDSGVAAAHPALSGATGVRIWGCGGKSVPDAHGTAVASLLVAGADAPATLYAADIYCGQPVGGAVSGLAEAMAWLARERVGVVNLSLVGPDNALLRRAVRALAERGHVLVAAVGNDGPAAPPLFPAAYPEVIAVTAVDARQRVLPEAGRGRHVDFAAPGQDLPAARPQQDWTRVRGTSFAAPLVARLAARYAPRPAPGNGERIRALFAAQARDLGRKGRDDTYGYGLLDGSGRRQIADADR